MEHYLTFGIILGLSAGFAPGPLLTLVISETLRHDIKSGIKVAVAPIITDLPIIAVSFLVISSLSDYQGVLGVISLTGGVFLLVMCYEGMNTKGHDFDDTEEVSRSLAKGVLANLLSPHPYLFWFSVGTPTVTKAMSENVISPVFFIVGFYMLLVGSKVLLAISVGKSKTFLSGNVYIYTMRVLGLMLGMFAFILFWDGLELLGIIKVGEN